MIFRCCIQSVIFIWRKIWCNIFENIIKHIICKTWISCYFVSSAVFLCVSHVFFNEADFVQETTLLLFTLGGYSRSMVSKVYLNCLGLKNETVILAKQDTFIPFHYFCFCPQTRSETEFKEIKLSGLLNLRPFQFNFWMQFCSQAGFTQMTHSSTDTMALILINSFPEQQKHRGCI